MTQWQYTSACITALAAGNDMDFDDVLCKFGAARWELVAYDFDSGVGIFKRPKVDDCLSTIEAEETVC